MVKVASPEIENFVPFSYSSRNIEDDIRTYKAHQSPDPKRTRILESRRDLELNALMQNKHISAIAELYELNENELNKKLPEITMKSVLNISFDPDLRNEARGNFKENLRKIERNYRFVNSELFLEINKWLEQRHKILDHLQGTLRMLHFLKQTTSALALISSALDLTRGIGTFLHTFFEVDLIPKHSSLLTYVVGGLSVTGSVFALSYFKQTVEDIFRNLREEKYILRNLLIIDRRGNSVDDDVEELFPYGIDISLVNQIALDIEESFLGDTLWKEYLTFAILLPNFKKNQRLINDRKFLASVKLFVESPAANIWLYRIKLRKLLDEMVTRLEDHLDKKVFDGNEVLNQAAINLYPIFFPLFVDSKNMEKLRFICSSIAGISAVVNLSQMDGKGFDDIRRMSDGLLKDYKDLKNFNEEFINEYD